MLQSLLRICDNKEEPGLPCELEERLYSTLLFESIAKLENHAKNIQLYLEQQWRQISLRKRIERVGQERRRPAVASIVSKRDAFGSQSCREQEQRWWSSEICLKTRNEREKGRKGLACMHGERQETGRECV